MNRELTYIYCLLALALATGCKKPYNPPVISSDNHYLVVEGVINSGNDSTFVSLSRTVKIAEDVRSQPVINSAVAIEGEQGGAMYDLQPLGDGRYFIGPMHLDATKKYRLHIKTSDNKEYASDYVEVKENPPIDSIGFTLKNNTLQIYVNTHNAANNTRYYRWDYAETWRFHTKFQSDYIVDPVTKQVRGRRPDEEVYYCFADDKSSNIIIGSSAKLAQDVIYQGPITTIPRDAEKISVRYSILLKQYALTKEGYQFWENMKKNTEQLGSIFDAQPTQLQGNIHCISNPAEPVIGYVSVTNTQSKRIFIDNSQIPDDWLVKYPYDCGIPDSARYFNPKSGIAEVDAFIVRGGAIALEKMYIQGADVGYTFSTEFCSVCTIRGRVQQPAFWK
ncbi:DUF4249 domain-containing protein [Mucilaginibacter sabulilitoris]|uniref:DUF4249 domain-containing protein n=1 Tax=Mucilaginibacter sabulilitoris TaxID=1173583 RepID=A0ABZ0TPD7_9SPHI|nr:DUF4249 domain-containing protein [Mucilaginibacter sabulilitoris]WPU94666.1 DUF4249 domain-containing protein [Mucilaginibacter sabulilitoris]